MIYYLSSMERVSQGDMEEYEAALKAAGCDLAPLSYVKKVRAFTKITSLSTSTPQPPSQTDALFRGFSNIGNKLTDRLKDTGFSGSFENLLTGVKNLLPSKKELAVTRIVENIMEPATNAVTEIDDYLQFDPKAGRNNGVQAGKAKAKVAFQEAIVFVVGGGNYVEYQNLQEYAQRQTVKKTITYGSTDLVTPHAFLQELGELSRI